jgi:NAD-dependent dihydropyrimidine dehydrogenase PreA subunit
MIKISYKKCCWKNGKCISCSCGSSSEKCEGCVEACPVGALERKNKVIFHKEKCISCGACVSACSKGAIKLIN